jgi:hypothetical protein
MMLASPTGIGDLSLSHAQEKSRLLLGSFFGGPHLFPFRAEYRSARVLSSGALRSIPRINAKLVPSQVFRPPERTESGERARERRIGAWMPGIRGAMAAMSGGSDGRVWWQNVPIS